MLEHHSARCAGLLTESTRQAMWRRRHARTRHVAAAQPAELVYLDTFYIGQLKVVGEVWQVTACDAARRVQRVLTHRGNEVLRAHWRVLFRATISRVLPRWGTPASIFFGAVTAAGRAHDHSGGVKVSTPTRI
jgi:hypothetical protein